MIVLCLSLISFPGISTDYSFVGFSRSFLVTAFISGLFSSILGKDRSPASLYFTVVFKLVLLSAAPDLHL